MKNVWNGSRFTDGKLMSNQENLQRLTLMVSSVLGEASAAINDMRDSGILKGSFNHSHRLSSASFLSHCISHLFLTDSCIVEKECSFIL
jgi:hypothetical protein